MILAMTMMIMIIYIYIYTYIYIDRSIERERERERHCTYIYVYTYINTMLSYIYIYIYISNDSWLPLIQYLTAMGSNMDLFTIPVRQRILYYSSLEGFLYYSSPTKYYLLFLSLIQYLTAMGSKRIATINHKIHNSNHVI